MINKDVLLGYIDDLSIMIDHVNCSELIYQLLENFLPDEINKSEDYQSKINDISYKLNLLLDVMDQNKVDYKIIYELYKTINCI